MKIHQAGNFRIALVSCSVSALLSLTLSAQQPSQDTTLAELRANNTSAVDNWPGSFNDLPKAGNISPLPISSLLPNGDKILYLAHIVPFFSINGKPLGAPAKDGHVNIGYDSDDNAQTVRQIADMRRRGFGGILLDWYGPDRDRSDREAQEIMHECDRLKQQGINFFFVIQPDKGVVTYKCQKDLACDTQKLTEALIYEYKTYESSPAYLRVNGRPVISFFWSDSAEPADWDKIASAVPGNPLFVFINTPGFTHPHSGGAFAWEGAKPPPDIGLEYLDRFYRAGASAPKDQITIGNAYAGFDDRLASWGKSKIIVRKCGLTWLETMAESQKFQSYSGKPLPFMSLMTWNDYEEGTALEPGIDNCLVSIPATVAHNRLTWSVTFGKDQHGFTGSEETLAYFRIFANITGDKLHELQRVSVKSPRTLDLTPFRLNPGQKLYIQAVGKSMILNHLSDAIPIP